MLQKNPEESLVIFYGEEYKYLFCRDTTQKRIRFAQSLQWS